MWKIHAAQNARRVYSAGERPFSLAGETPGDWLAGTASRSGGAVSADGAGCGEYGLLAACVALSGFRRETRSRIASALERVGLDAMALSTIDALSGGQFQRMLFARILVQQAPLVMLDEPFTGVDEATCNVLMDLMLEMYMQGQTLLAVLHDSERVSRHFPQTLRLDTAIPHWKTERVRVA